MKIDIHTHTKKVKAGDSEHRNVNVDTFNDIIRATDVNILAITNHNHFDLVQYTQFRDKTADHCKIWPGIEFDVWHEGNRAHLIVIANPNNVVSFNSKVLDLLARSGLSADKFTVGLDSIVSNFDDLDCIYIAHYHSKKPNLLDKDLDILLGLVKNKKRVLKEASNSISAGIYINHGHNSIYGSDVHDWREYHNLAKSLPELRLPVETFEQFCLLLEKDTTTIKTVLDKKSKDSVSLTPFGIAETIELDIYNDINIIFGSKGTGKTEILRELSKYYNGLGFKTEVYESSTKKLDEVFDIKGATLNVTVESYGIDDCVEDFRIIRNASEQDVTKLSSYSQYFAAEERSKIAKSIAIDDYNILDDSLPKRSFEEIRITLDELKNFQDFIEKDELLQNVAGAKLYKRLTDVLEEISEKIRHESEGRLTDYRTIFLFNNIVRFFVDQIAKKTGQPRKPVETGFRKYASNRISIERSVKKILSNIEKEIKAELAEVGGLGEKGILFCQTNLKIQNGSFTHGAYTPTRKVYKGPQKQIAQSIASISKHLYLNTLFEKIAEMKVIEHGDTITCINDLLLFNRHFSLDGTAYVPSNGESSMVLLHKELKEDRDIYIIDEPEKSLGNDYISEVIVPLLKERAQMGKKIIIATHDANIAVRTLPYNSIYRKHDISSYFTYTGNPFSNNLVCTRNVNPNLDWKEISMKTLEGGRNAFGERSKIYGTSSLQSIDS